MQSSRLIRAARLDRLERKAGVSDRAVVLAFSARFVDEVLSGAFTVLTPVFRREFGLSLVQVGLLSQVLDWVALAVEPVAATQIDLRSRRALMTFGAAATGMAIGVMAGANEFVALAVGFGLYGLGSGPLVHTADVLVVEAFPGAPERAFNRATFVDTCGALLGPASIAAATALGIDWRLVLASAAVATLVYAIATARTAFSEPPARSQPTAATDASAFRAALGNVRSVLRDARARRLLLTLFWFDLFEAAFVLKYVWLHEQVGLSEPLVAAYAVGEQCVALVAILALDRWLATRAAATILRLACAALAVLPVAWVLAPGVGGRVAVGVPLAFAQALVWPIAKARSLAALPDRAGATQAVAALFPLVPMVVAVAALADVVGVGAAMAGTGAVAAVILFFTA